MRVTDVKRLGVVLVVEIAATVLRLVSGGLCPHESVAMSACSFI